jgi:hypothetical protein
MLISLKYKQAYKHMNKKCEIYESNVSPTGVVTQVGGHAVVIS